MPPKLKKAPAVVDGGGPSVLDRIKAQKVEQAAAAAPAPAPAAKRKAQQVLDVDRKGPLEVVALLSGVRAGNMRWCRKCADLFNPKASETQQCPGRHANFQYAKPSPALQSQLEDAEAHIVNAARTVQSGSRGRAVRRLHGPKGRAATRLQSATRQRAAKRTVQRQRARQKVEEGESAISAKNWETAIEKLKAGLAVEGTRDEELTRILRATLDGAKSSMSTRDAARDQAEAHLVEGASFMASRDYTKAINTLQLALELDTQSDDISERLQESLVSAETALAAEKSAKQEAADLVSSAETSMLSHDYIGAIAAHEAALALDVNDDDLTARFQAGLKAAQDAQASANDAARAKLSEGESAVSVEDWQAAIESLNAGLEVEGLHDAELTASLRAALQGAEASKAAHDAAAAAAEAERQRVAAAAEAERQRIAAEEANAEERRRQEEEAEQARIAAEAAEVC